MLRTHVAVAVALLFPGVVDGGGGWRDVEAGHSIVPTSRHT